MSRRLCNAVLDNLPAGCRRPAYDRGALKAGIVHLGVGAFHRSHFATYVDELCSTGDRDWSIVGAGLREIAVHHQRAGGDVRCFPDARIRK